MLNNSSQHETTPRGTVGFEAQSAKRKLMETSPENSATVGNMQTTELIKLMNETMSKLLDSKLENLPTKSDLVEVRNTIEGVQNEVQRLTAENDELRSEVKFLKESKEADNRRMERLEEELGRKKLIIRGLPSQNALYNAAEKLFKAKMNIGTNLEIEYIRKLQQNENTMSIMVEMKSTKMVTEVLKHTKTLAGSSIFIERDLTGSRLEKKKIMLQLKKDLLVVNRDKRVGVRADRIIIDGKTMFWNEKKELICDGKQAKDVLLSIYGNVIQDIGMIEYDRILSKINSKNY